MSCPNSNAPIDISIQKSSGKCDLKCAYNFKYPNSSCTATNRGDYISLSYDATSTSPVTYNAVGYNVQEIRLYVPSLHTFNGSHAVGEIMIIHVSNKGTKPLLVCVPLTEGNSSSSEATFILSSIVTAMASNAPSEGETTNVNMNNFTMDAFVPKKPYFSYTAIQPYQPCVGDVDLIVFTPLMAKCSIDSGTLNKLNTIISENSYTTKTGPLLFFNEKGPGSSVGDEIYIDCKPVNQSAEETMITQSTESSSSSFSFSSPSVSIDMNSILDSPAFQIFLASLLFIFILLVFSVVTKAFSGGGSKSSGTGMIASMTEAG